MLIRLLKDIEQNGTIKTSKHRGLWTMYAAGTVVEASDATAAKWIAEGLAEPFKETADA